MKNGKKVILLAGPTASGKSDLAIKLAKAFNGEIINADSMQVYREISILNSRPKLEEIKKIKHHLFFSLKLISFKILNGLSFGSNLVEIFLLIFLLGM